MQKLAQQLTQGQFAEWMAVDIDARRKGGPNCQAKYLKLAERLPREIIAETKENVIEVWSRLERELKPAPQKFERREFSEEQIARWQAERSFLDLSHNQKLIQSQRTRHRKSLMVRV
jgi:hypothetical protein